MFSIVLKRNQSELNKVIKDTVVLSNLRGVLKAGTSIIDPVILIEASVAVVSTANYLTVEEFRRSYFINNISTAENGLVEISCHVDVLSSYASQIKAQHGIIRRQENSWNLYLNDGVFKVYQNPTIFTQEFPSGFTTPSFVLAVAG